MVKAVLDTHMREWIKRNRSTIILGVEYLILALFVLLPAMRWGYFFALDNAMTPSAQVPDWQSPGALFAAIVYAANFLLPTIVIEKILLLLTIWCFGYGMHRLTETVVQNEWAAYFAGLLGIFNPWVYARLIYGQWGVVLACALIPWFLLVLYKASTDHSWQPKTAILVASIGIAIGSIAIHMAFPTMLIFGIFCSIYLGVFYKKYRAIPRRFLVWLCVVMGVIFFATIHWFLPTVRGVSATGELLTQGISMRDVYAFQTVADSRHGLAFNVAALYGFWGEREMRFVNMKELVPGWQAAAVGIMVLAAIGVMSLRKKDELDSNETHVTVRLFLGTMLIVCVASFVGALGVASPIVGRINQWIYEHVGLYKGFREPQKLVGILVIGYGLFGGIGVRAVQAYLSRINIKRQQVIASVQKYVLPLVILLLPVYYGNGLLWGLRGQLCIGQYPKSWHDVNNLLVEKETEGRILFVPWHMYLNLSFACYKVVNNPATRFFGDRVISGDNLEFGGIYTQSAREISQALENTIFLGRRNNKDRASVSPIGESLKKLGIHYILLAHESDDENYEFVRQDKSLVPVFESPEITLYRNIVW